MTKKTSEKRTEAFFTALAETGNQTISAERARVSRSWMTLHRSTDPAFKARMEAAIVAARERLSRAGAVTTAGKWANINGEKLVLRGSRGRRVQVSRARLKQWTAGEEKRFLAVLSATCNVKLACGEVGLSPQSAHGHRNRWPDFAARWDAAVEEGYDALELALLENGIRSLDPQAEGEMDWQPATPMQPITVDQASRLLGLHRRTATGAGRYPGGKTIRASEEAAASAILQAIAKMQRADALRSRGGKKAAN